MNIRCVDQCHGAEEADRNAQHDPEREFDFQKQRQHDEDQQCAHGQVFQHHAQAAFQVEGDIRPDVQTGCRGQLPLLLLDPGACRFRCVEDVLLAHGKHLNAKGVAAVETCKAAVLDEAVTHGCNIAEQQPGAIREAAQHNGFEILLHVGLPLRTQQDIALTRAQGAGGQVQRRARNHVGYIAQGQVVFTQQRFGDFDGDFVVARANHFRRRYLRQGQQVAADILCQGFHAAFIQLTGEL